MTRKDHISSPKRKKTKKYKKFSEEGEKDEYKRYAENIKMFPVDDTPKPFDQYEELKKIAKQLFDIVNPATKEEQKNFENYKPKAFGEKRTYPQNWQAYNPAKCGELLYFRSILDELLVFIDEENRSGRRGRPPYQTRDKIFSMCFQMYNKKGSRKAIGYLNDAKRDGYVSRAPPIGNGFNSLLNFYADSGMTPILKRLIHLSALPFRNIEKHVSIDSTGFSTNVYESWQKNRLEDKSVKRQWKKAHIICGVVSNAVLNVDITPGHSHDAPPFEHLIREINDIFVIEKLSADMAYSSRDIYKICQELEITPYIPFKKGSTGRPKGVRLWRITFDQSLNPSGLFWKGYHSRSNSESTNWMLKYNFEFKLRTKNEVSQTNEILVKCLCHNICCLIQEFFEIGLNIDFASCAELLSAQKMPEIAQI